MGLDFGLEAAGFRLGAAVDGTVIDDPEDFFFPINSILRLTKNNGLTLLIAKNLGKNIRLTALKYTA